MRQHNLQPLMKVLNYQFQHVALLKQALTHRSATVNHNERLEFLGDSILNFSIATALYAQFPQCNEGELSRMRATLVKEQTLGIFAKQFNLSDYIILGQGELKSGGTKRISILADCVEAIIGAIYLDANLDTVVTLIQQWYATLLSEIKPGENQKDPKSRLQEYLQARRMPLPSYDVVSIKGEAHRQQFTVKCKIDSFEQVFVGESSSRRKAEQIVAQQIIEKLGIK